MERIIKQIVGIDCAQDDLAVSFGTMDERLNKQIKTGKTFANNKDGYRALLNWCGKLEEKGTELGFVIEATGVYHEQVSLFLHQQGKNISVVLPNRIKHYAGTENIKTVTDKIMAQVITRFGLEKTLDKWEPPHAVYNELRQLSRERDQLNTELTLVKNQLHAEQAGAWPNKSSIKRMGQRIALLEKQQDAILKEIAGVVNSHDWLKDRVKKICTIKGVGFITAVTVIAETNGFNLIRNKKQIVGYAGLDVQEKTSGTSVNAKPRISRKGNKFLRKAVYFPALSAIRSDSRAKELFIRLVSKHGIKMKAAVAVQRKLLELIYILWKNNEVYNPRHEEQKKLGQPIQAALNEIA